MFLKTSIKMYLKLNSSIKKKKKNILLDFESKFQNKKNY
jgi:hypothetical protein